VSDGCGGSLGQQGLGRGREAKGAEERVGYEKA
jgi:hypothetical protein